MREMPQPSLERFRFEGEVVNPQVESLPVRVVKQILGSIRDSFRFFVENDQTLAAKMKHELEVVEKMATKEGVDFSRCQIAEVVRDYTSGKKIEFESFSPYLSDYNLATGEIWPDKLTEADICGIEIAKVLRAVFPQARLVSLYDEYNTNLPDSSDERGIPQPGAVQLVLPESTKQNFKDSLGGLLKKHGVIGKNDKEGKDFVFISESSKIEDAEKLVEQLRAAGHIEEQGKSIFFINNEAENPLYRKIRLRTAHGRWLCEALDASSYLKPENLDITHLVVLPNHFKEQQDKVWEILRTLGIQSNRYHNIFFDEKADPGRIADVIKADIGYHQKANKLP